VIQSIEDLIDSLDDPEGDPHHMQHGVRETHALTRGLENAMSNKASFATSSGAGSRGSMSTPVRQSSQRSLTSTPSNYSMHQAGAISPYSNQKTGEALIDVLKIRAARLGKSEDFVAKFLEVGTRFIVGDVLEINGVLLLQAADGYHKITKKLIEQKQATSRLWGGAN
jgi:hypothetical protein